MRALASLLERALLTAVFAGSAAALLLAARNGLAPEETPLTFGLVLWQWYVLFALAVALPLAAAGWIAGRLARREWVGRAPVAAYALGVLAVALVLNGKALAALTHLEGPARFRWLSPLGFVLALLGLAAVALAPDRRRSVPRLLALLTLAAGLGSLLPGSPRAARADAGRGTARTSGERLLVVGVDGADWDYLEPLLARGDLPHFAALRARGAWGKLRTIQPTRSPIIWTTMVTGRKPEDHGVEGFTYPRLGGIQQGLPPLKPLRALGFDALEGYLVRSKRIRESPVTSFTRRTPAFWNLASAQGSPVSVVNWWATFPAEPVLGYVVSERTFYEPPDPTGGSSPSPGLVSPAALYAEIGPLIMRPREMTLDEAREFVEVTPEEFEAMRTAPPTTRREIQSSLTYFFAMFETGRRHALHLIEKGKRDFGAPPDTFALFRLVDMTCHTSLRHSELVKDNLGASPEQVRKHGRVVTAAYRRVDRALGELMAAFGEGDVIVLSDHGWALQHAGGGRDYGHGKAPAGIFLAAGPAFRAGPVEGLSVYDVMPLLARLKGWPVAEDLAGRLPEEVLTADFRAAHPVQRVATYGRREDLGIATGSAAVDEEMLERLRALGYIQ